MENNRKNQFYNLQSEKDNNQPIHYFFIQETENNESVIINSTMEKELKGTFYDDSVEQQDSIKIEVIEQTNYYNRNLEEDIKKQIIEEEGNIQPRDDLDLFVQERKGSESVITSSNTKEKFDEHDYNVKELQNIKIEVIEQIKNNIETSEKLALEEEIENENNMNLKILSDGKKKYACDRCSKRFTYHSWLISHIRTHTKDKSYACKQCSKKYNHQCSLVQHIQTHVGENPNVCNICDKNFATSSALKSHLMIHSGKKSYACDQCSKRFIRRSDLLGHIRTHTGEKPYTCNQCSKRFTHSSCLIAHIRTHNGEKAYACNQCNKKFNHPGNLVRHIRMHLGEKPYVCNICDKMFTDSTGLKTHLEVHSGKKNHACDQCSKRFNNRQNLIRHFRTHRR